jgi:hypothetical protein
MTTERWEQRRPFWYHSEICCDLFVCGEPTVPVISATIDSGVFRASDNVWCTNLAHDCVITARCSFINLKVDPFMNKDIQIASGLESKPLTDLVLSLRADAQGDEPRRLLQWAPGPNGAFLLQVEPFRVVPRPLLADGIETRDYVATWKGLHFALASPKSGKRYAAQKYTDIIVELLAGSYDDKTDDPWICIAQQKSEPLVIRTSPPHHYADTPPNFNLYKGPQSIFTTMGSPLKASSPHDHLVFESGWQVGKEKFLWHAAAQTLLVVTERGILGRGRTGEVEEVVVQGSKVAMARKRVFVPRMHAPQAMETYGIRAEIENLKELNHQHIVKALGCYQERSGRHGVNFFTLLFPAGDNDLGIFLAETCKDAPLEELEQYRPWIGSWLVCLTSALAYLHHHGIHHEDIKRANIIHRHDTVYFTDFSSSRKIKSWEETSTESPAIATRLFAAPEAMYEESGTPRRGSKTDIYSLGLVFVAMLTVMAGKDIDDLRSFVFSGTEGRFQYHRVGRKFAEWFMQEPLNRTVDARNTSSLFLREMLAYDRKSRASAQAMVDKFNGCGSKWVVARCDCSRKRWDKKQRTLDHAASGDVADLGVLP